MTSRMRSVSESIDTSSAEHRLQCEARHWLREGYNTPETVADLMTRIEAERGRTAAAELRKEMRRQWSRRREWLGAGP